MSALANDVFAMLSRELPPSVSSGDALQALAVSHGDAAAELEPVGARIADWIVRQAVSERTALLLVGRWLESQSSDGSMHHFVGYRLVEMGAKAQVDSLRILLSAAPTFLKQLKRQTGETWWPFLESVRASLSSEDQERLLDVEQRALVPSAQYPAALLPSLVVRARAFLEQHPERMEKLEAALQAESPSNIAAATLAHVVLGSPAPAGDGVPAFFNAGFRSVLERNLPPRIVPESHLGYEQWSAFQYAYKLDPFLRERFVEAVESFTQDPVADAALRDLARLALETLR